MSPIPWLVGSRFKVIITVTNKIANGSFAPDSISSVACTRSFSLTPPFLSRLNTAAASVEPTIAAIKTPSRQSTSKSQVVKIPATNTVTKTPKLAKVTAGLSPTRNERIEVRRPPSNKIHASAA